MNKYFKSIVIVLLGLALGAILYKKIKYNFTLNSQVDKPTKAQMIRSEILKFKKPARIEVETYTQKYQEEIADIKKIKVPMNNKSDFYIQIQIFSDDSDEKSPLVIQMKFKDVRSNNLIKETSLSIE